VGVWFDFHSLSRGTPYVVTSWCYSTYTHDLSQGKWEDINNLMAFSSGLAAASIAQLSKVKNYVPPKLCK
jgi:hypothetical protein